MKNHLSFLSGDVKRVFFCGIGGASMSGLAIMTKRLGYEVIGSDSTPKPENIRLFRENKIPFYFSHDKNNIEGCDAFIYTSAVGDANPELIQARKNGIEIFSRAEYLGKISDTFYDSIAVSGTHGKSTVTYMLGEIFTAAERFPYVLAGAKTPKNSSSFIEGRSDTIIYEACEYGRSFLSFNPKTAIVLNIEREHTDIYPTLSDSVSSFSEFAKKSSLLILNQDDEGCLMLANALKNSDINTLFYSLHRTRNSLYAENLSENRGYYTFDIYKDGKAFIKNVSLRVPGIHNVSNLLAATLCATSNGIENPEQIKTGIENFKGIKRRFEYIGTLSGADIYDDYAHHPTEIKATLKFAKKMGYKRIVCAFQPHTYSRTFSLFSEFTGAFEDCDEVIFADIFPAREKNVYGVSSSQLAAATKNGKYVGNQSKIFDYLKLSAHPKTLILTMGAGMLNEVAEALATIERE